MAPTELRIDALLEGLRAVTPVVGDTTRWTLAERMTHYRCPGVGIAVIENGALVWSDGFGVMDASEEARSQRPVDERTLFAGASMSKPVTAMLALQLVDQDLIDLDADINRYLKRWQVPANAFTAQSPVTLRWLLGHKAGTSVHGCGGVGTGAARPTLLDMLEGRHPARGPAVRVEAVPGGAARYSGGGFTIVELLIEDITGQPFQAVVAERILKPLGMTSTTFAHPLPAALEARTASGHAAGAKVIPGKWVLSPQVAACGMYSTPADYARFMIACRDAWLGRPGALISRTLARQMMQVQAQSTFGLGWEVLHDGAAKRFEHAGSNDGFQCLSVTCLESGNGAVVMTNAESGMLLYWEIFAAIADAFSWPHFMREPKRLVPITATDRATLIGRYEIVEGPQAIPLRIFERDGALFSTIDGVRLSTHEIRMDDTGRISSDKGPWEAEVVQGADGRAVELIMLRDGLVEQMRARRA